MWDRDCACHTAVLHVLLCVLSCRLKIENLWEWEWDQRFLSGQDGDCLLVIKTGMKGMIQDGSLSHVAASNRSQGTMQVLLLLLYLSPVMERSRVATRACLIVASPRAVDLRTILICGQVRNIYIPYDTTQPPSRLHARVNDAAGGALIFASLSRHSLLQCLAIRVCQMSSLTHQVLIRCSNRDEFGSPIFVQVRMVLRGCVN